MEANVDGVAELAEQVATAEVKADLLPVQNPDAVKLNSWVVTRLQKNAETVIICAKHKSTGEKKYWAEVLGQEVGEDKNFRSRTKLEAFADEQLYVIRAARQAAILAEMTFEEAPVDEPVLTLEGDLVSAETVVQIEADEKAIPVEQWVAEPQ